MNEKRKLQRRQLSVQLDVIDRATRQPLGQLVDITSEGMMVAGKAPVETPFFYQLIIPLPEKILGKERLEIDAESVWCRSDLNPQQFTAGFQFLNPREENIHAIVGLVVKFGVPE
jgi:hypothetical protein